MDVSKVDFKKITILNQLTFLNMTNIPEHSKQKKSQQISTEYWQPIKY